MKSKLTPTQVKGNQTLISKLFRSNNRHVSGASESPRCARGAPWVSKFLTWSRSSMGPTLTCDGFFREPVSGRLKLCERLADVVIGRVVLLDGVTWPWVVTGPPGDKAGGLGRENGRVSHFLELVAAIVWSLNWSLKVLFYHEQFVCFLLVGVFIFPLLLCEKSCMTCCNLS